ncbi:hypothetical protein QFZ52_001001 [Arthrobacter woluwensis]|nr:hypothetical protein [Arthrobacter woluwensis]
MNEKPGVVPCLLIPAEIAEERRADGWTSDF